MCEEVFFLIDLIKLWQEYDVLPAVVSEYGTGKILMIGYQNKESLALTLKTGEAWYYKKDSGEVKRRGAHSGNTQHVREIKMNCSCDAFLFIVEQKGRVCHTGHSSCFFHSVYSADNSRREKFGRLVLDSERHQKP